MNHVITSGLAALTLLVALAACDKAETPAPAPTSAFEVTVAPLQLAGIRDATWRVAVTNLGGETVWTRDVASSQFGDNAGAITYVGPCDVDSSPNTVSLTLLSLVADSATGPQVLSAGADYVDPGTLTQTLPCVENTDVPVVFNITLLRRAQQGFFDVAVNFRDIFCSAKLDCDDALLHDASGERGPTVIMAFACTTGDLTPTYQYLSEVTLSCVDADPSDEQYLAPLTQQLSPASAQTEGNQGAAPPLLFEWARYSVQEQLPGLDKCAWNHAFGLDMVAIGARRCTFSATGTASDVPLVGGALPADAVWPLITWQGEVVGAAGSLCQNQALDAVGSAVATSYQVPVTDGSPALSFAAEHTCAGLGEPLGFACDETGDTVFRSTRLDTEAAVAVTVAGVPAAAVYRLPLGASLQETCCQDACCSE